jgi:hypothetical protein
MAALFVLARRYFCRAIRFNFQTALSFVIVRLDRAIQ